MTTKQRVLASPCLSGLRQRWKWKTARLSGNLGGVLHCFAVDLDVMHSLEALNFLTLQA
jgi:hypothetical protein